MKPSSIAATSISLLLLAQACSSAGAVTTATETTGNEKVPTATLLSSTDAIDKIRSLAGFPLSELSYVDITVMANSPRGNLRVEHYRDVEGRSFYVEPGIHIVVEIDARNMLGIAHPTPTSLLSAHQLEAKARELVQAAIPEFASLEDSMSCELGQKVNVFFFDCREPMEEGAFMPRMIQVGFTQNGEMFAYINTVSIP